MLRSTSAKRSFESSFELRAVKEERWLRGNRSVLLEIETAYDDSGDRAGPTLLLYDFERDDLRVCGHAARRMSTCDELKKIVDQLR